ncbi:MBL fold metallo-hydrolase [Sediminivirga luteola]|uniref:Zn-dependent hydrolase n=2 Tax=Sediminivirga luteola TaxID=1774748 RepID=A0A8J2TW91_9MICO|nr:Zn-dependent hydrolase [Sediminivirga luteola]
MMGADNPGTGDVQARRFGEVAVRTVAVSEMENNVYLLTGTATGQRVLIDAADEPEAIAALVAASADDIADPAGTADPVGTPEADDVADARGAGRGDGLHAVITTHRHWDHHRALAAVLRQLGGEAGVMNIAGVDDADAIEEETGTTVDVRAEHGDVLEFDGFELSVIALRGHTPGSIALLLRQDGEPPVLFTGDSLFPGGPGKTWSAEDFTSLMDDLQERVFGVLPDETLVFPGHGAPTTLGAERPHLGEWRARGW